MSMSVKKNKIFLTHIWYMRRSQNWGLLKLRIYATRGHNWITHWYVGYKLPHPAVQSDLSFIRNFISTNIWPNSTYMRCWNYTIGVDNSVTNHFLPLANYKLTINNTTSKQKCRYNHGVSEYLLLNVLYVQSLSFWERFTNYTTSRTT